MSGLRERVELGRLDGRVALLLDGVVQSVLPAGLQDVPEGYWRWLLPEQPPQHVLLLGLGGGTVVRLLQARFRDRPAAVTGVDNDAEVLKLAAQQFGFDLAGLCVVQADAWTFLKASLRRGKRFDLVVVDLFHDGAIPGFVAHRGFLRDVARVLTSEGLLTINFNRGGRHRAQLAALSRSFVLRRAIGAGMNLIVHAHARPPRRYRRR